VAVADVILSSGDVLTMDLGSRLIRDGAVVVCGKQIAALGPTEQILRDWEAPQVLDCHGHAIIPGLINAHTHAAMSLFRGLADDLRLDVWLYGYIMPVEKRFVSPDFCRLGTLLACAEMIRSGVTCFADMYYFEDDVARAAAETGIRAVCAQTIIRTPAPDAMSYDVSLEACAAFLQRWSGNELVTPAVGPHSLYLCTDDILRTSSLLALEHDALLHIHMAETEQEVKDLTQQFGVAPVIWMKEQGLLVGKMLMAHGVHLTREEIDLMAERNIGVAHNPTSNLKLASGIAPVCYMLDSGVPVGVGTDGCASNNDLDMFEETRLAALLPKGVNSDPTALPAQQSLRMATIDGARALHLDQLTGSLEPGKRADIITVSLEGLHTNPGFDMSDRNHYSRIVYGSKSSDVRDVMVNGRILMRDRRLLTVDTRAVLEEIRPVADQIGRFLSAREENLLDKLLALGGLHQEETFEVQVKARLEAFDEILGRLAQIPLITIERSSSRRQFDTYLLFTDISKGHIRYREDEVVQADGTIAPRYRLTLRGPKSEREYEGSVILTRSRFTAPAVRSLRFYREYLQPDQVREVQKNRRRFHVLYKGMPFQLNFDRITRPELPGMYLEVKSRTWSSADAMRKAEYIREILDLLRVPADRLLTQEYMTL
jgi:5-methylthioadenosine/S-adenosylhomocysteine deaminase